MTSRPVNFVCLKWGSKYGSDYVNRLHRAIRDKHRAPLNFLCFTDEHRGIDEEVEIRDISSLRRERSNCFTIEKIHLFDSLEGDNVLLDIDVLMLKGVDDYLEDYAFSEGRFVQNHWMNLDFAEVMKNFRTNYVNSSVVTWRDDQLQWIKKFYRDNRSVVEFCYGDLDTFLFQCLWRELKFHPKSLAYSYNSSGPVENLDYSIALFNTSQGRGVELHEVKGPLRELWTRYD